MGPTSKPGTPIWHFSAHQIPPSPTLPFCPITNRRRRSTPPYPLLVQAMLVSKIAGWRDLVAAASLSPLKFYRVKFSIFFIFGEFSICLMRIAWSVFYLVEEFMQGALSDRSKPAFVFVSSLPYLYCDVRIVIWAVVWLRS